MSLTNKQPQTCYVEANPEKESGTWHIDQGGTELYLQTIKNVYLHTPAELETIMDGSISIDELLSEFERRGFDVSNWDGEEGAEKAIVDGVVSSIAAMKAEWETKLQNKVSELLLFVEGDGKPVDGFRFRDIATELKGMLVNTPKK